MSENSESQSLPTTAKEVKKGGGWLIGLGILNVIFGMIAIGSPLMAGITVSLIVGIFLAAGGVLQISHAFQVPAGGGKRIFLILSGLFALGFGIFMTTRPVASLLAMTVVPGFGGQSFMEDEVMPKVSAAAAARHDRGLSFHIEVDGGINDATAPIAARHGANVLVAGTGAFRAANMQTAIMQLRKA